MEPFDRFPPAVQGAGQTAPSYFFTVVLIFEILLSLITISEHIKKAERKLSKFLLHKHTQFW